MKIKLTDPSHLTHNIYIYSDDTQRALHVVNNEVVPEDKAWSLPGTTHLSSSNSMLVIVSTTNCFRVRVLNLLIELWVYHC